MKMKSEDDAMLPHLDHIPATVSEILDQITLRNTLALFITVNMSILWLLSVMPTLAPAFMAPNSDYSNKTFVTIQKEFNLTKALYDPAEMTSSVFFLGNMVLGQIYCIAADRIGRRPILVFSLLVSGAVGVLGAMAPCFSALLLGRFIQGSFFSVITMTNYVLCCECIGLKSHAAASMVFGIFWVVGYCAISPISLFVASWRELQFWVSMPCLVFGVIMLCTLPESFAFLIAAGKHAEASKWINLAQGYSKIPLKANIGKAIEHEISVHGAALGLWETMLNIVKSGELRLYVFVQTILWFVDLMIYTALCLTAGDIGGDNEHLSFTLSGLVELPCYFFLPYFLDKYGRKPTVIGVHLLTAVALSAMTMIDPGTIWFGAWMMAKFAMASAFMCCFVYGAEIFPTENRNICLGLCGTVSNIGAIFAPHSPILDLIWPGLMFNTFAIFCVLCAGLTVYLPETKDSH